MKVRKKASPAHNFTTFLYKLLILCFIFQPHYAHFNTFENFVYAQNNNEDSSKSEKPLSAEEIEKLKAENSAADAKYQVIVGESRAEAEKKVRMQSLIAQLNSVLGLHLIFMCKKGIKAPAIDIYIYAIGSLYIYVKRIYLEAEEQSIQRKSNKLISDGSIKNQKDATEQFIQMQRDSLALQRKQHRLLNTSAFFEALSAITLLAQYIIFSLPSSGKKGSDLDCVEKNQKLTMTNALIFSIIKQATDMILGQMATDKYSFAPSMDALQKKAKMLQSYAFNRNQLFPLSFQDKNNIAYFSNTEILDRTFERNYLMNDFHENEARINKIQQKKMLFSAILKELRVMSEVYGQENKGPNKIDSKKVNAQLTKNNPPGTYTVSDDSDISPAKTNSNNSSGGTTSTSSATSGGATSTGTTTSDGGSTGEESSGQNVLGGTAEAATDWSDKALKFVTNAIPRLVIEAGASAFVRFASNNVNKAINEYSDSINGYERDYLARKRKMSDIALGATTGSDATSGGSSGGGSSGSTTGGSIERQQIKLGCIKYVNGIPDNDPDCSCTKNNSCFKISEQIKDKVDPSTLKILQETEAAYTGGQDPNLTDAEIEKRNADIKDKLDKAIDDATKKNQFPGMDLKAEINKAAEDFNKIALGSKYVPIASLSNTSTSNKNSSKDNGFQFNMPEYGPKAESRGGIHLQNNIPSNVPLNDINQADDPSLWEQISRRYMLVSPRFQN